MQELETSPRGDANGFKVAKPGHARAKTQL
jgi:hypothetical protein